MKNRIFSLVLGLMVILLASCLESCSSASVVDAGVSTFVDAGVSAVADAGFSAVADAGDFNVADAGVSAVADAGTPELLQEDLGPATSMLDWQNIISIVLLVISTVFGVFWSKARGVLNALHDGLADNNLSKEDIQKIIKAWKGV
jgi:hypothetical protein